MALFKTKAEKTEKVKKEEKALPSSPISLAGQSSGGLCTRASLSSYYRKGLPI